MILEKEKIASHIKTLSKNYFQINVNFVVEHDDDNERHDVLDRAGDQSVPDPVLDPERGAVCPVLKQNEGKG